MPEYEKLNPAQVHEVLTEIAQGVASVAPEGWVEASYNSINVAIFQQESAPTLLEDGGVVDNVMSIPNSIGKLVRDLKRGMYEPGKGSWYAMGIVVMRDGRFKAEYNYDRELREDLPLPDNYFALDLTLFPREKKYIPDWVVRKLENVAGGELAD
ncbi:hypothetical protein HNR23_003911 [Nocardiopsis mwathae]|uniref:Uncharacterized protein n=1 Tax=Nocardiopsis mwathae TaxID=1472723 RepID=A0A7W9YLN9_9ACTN|nr:hypothetical protein [Nocardiopsis mwathae]MBB6173851.1 hypothetical protein [Nocardiopsis mwathae]